MSVKYIVFLYKNNVILLRIHWKGELQGVLRCTVMNQLTVNLDLVSIQINILMIIKEFQCKS